MLCDLPGRPIRPGSLGLKVMPVHIDIRCDANERIYVDSCAGIQYLGFGGRFWINALQEEIEAFSRFGGELRGIGIEKPLPRRSGHCWRKRKRAEHRRAEMSVAGEQPP